jgi:signal recognition particle receptor subunit beta
MEERRAALAGSDPARFAEVNARIVYWGVHGAGKRTNLRVIHAKLRPDHRGELREMPTRLDPTTSYALLPIELGEVGGVRTRIQVLTAPAGAEQAPTRKQLLDRADGVVFVADAQRERLGENLACFEELRAALQAYGRPLEQVPLVIQYNKRDLSDPYVLEELHRKLGMRGVAAFEAVAREGTAVLQTLTTISKRVIRHRRETSAQQGFEPSAEPPAPAPPLGTTQLLTRMIEPEPMPAPPAPPARAQQPAAPEELGSVFEPSFDEAAAPEPAPPAGPLFAVKGLGAPAGVDAQTLVVPVRLRDGSGRVRQLTLRLRIEAIEDERG